MANFSVKDVEYSNVVNPSGIATWDGDLSAFSGGKYITYRGPSDSVHAIQYVPETRNQCVIIRWSRQEIRRNSTNEWLISCR